MKISPVFRFVMVFMMVLMAALLAIACAPKPVETAVLPPTLPPPTAEASPPTQQPQLTPVPTAGCSQVEGTVGSGTYRGAAVAQEVPYLIYLPPCYDQRSERYHTLYLLHGFPFDENHWMDLGAAELVDIGIARDGWPPVILVMPLQPEPLFRGSDGGPGSYETELLEGLIPHVESTYRVDLTERSLGGISRGGVWALEIGFLNPEEFVAVAGLSPALAVNYPRPLYDPFEISVSGQPLPVGILLVAGEDDWAKTETVRLSEVLNSQGHEHSLQLVKGDHSDTTWAAAMPEVLRFLIFGAS